MLLQYNETDLQIKWSHHIVAANRNLACR